MVIRYLMAGMAATALIATLSNWTFTMHERGELNFQAIDNIHGREDRHANMHDEHRADHLVFKSEYREDQSRIEEKLDRVLERLLEHIETAKEKHQ